MKKIINGKKYDTETATLIDSYWNGRSQRDFKHLSEELYRKNTGEFFLYGEGGPMTDYKKPCGDMWGSGEEIRPLTDDEAREWAEIHTSVETYEALFGPVEE